MGLSRTTAPTETPVSLSEAKDHLRVTTDDLNLEIASFVEAATEWAETFTGRAFVTQTWSWTMDTFPSFSDPLEVPKPPLSSVTSIKYVDDDGVTQTWAATNYDVDTTHLPGRIGLAYDKETPSDVRTGIVDAVTIAFIAGYGAASAVPHSIKAAIKLYVEMLFDRDPRQRETLKMASEALAWRNAVVQLT